MYLYLFAEISVTKGKEKTEFSFDCMRSRYF